MELPDWYEPLVGSDPNTANQNDDPDNDGWTMLEDFLDFIAHPYIIVSPNNSGTIDVKPFFAGFYGQNDKYNTVTPTFSVATESNLFTPSVNGSVVTAAAGPNGGIGTILVTVNDGETTFTQRFGVAVTGTTTGITEITPSAILNPNAPRYNLAGQRIGNNYKGIVIQNGRAFVSK